MTLLKALMCGINAVGAQGCSCMVTIYHASLKMAILLHKEATVRFDLILAVHCWLEIDLRKMTSST